MLHEMCHQSGLADRAGQLLYEELLKQGFHEGGDMGWVLTCIHADIRVCVCARTHACVSGHGAIRDVGPDARHIPSTVSDNAGI